MPITLFLLAALSTFAADPAVVPQAATPETMFTPQLAWGADLRYRHEYISSQNPSSGNSVINQHRIRARLVAKVIPSEDIALEFRLATGSGRTSTNQTLGNSASAFSNYSILLDRASFRWTPGKHASLLGGRIANPFYTPGESDLVWDSDLNLDGLAAELSCGSSESKLFFTPGFFWVDKNTSTGKEVTIHSAQVGYKRKISEAWQFGTAIAIHDYKGILDHNGIASTSDSSGNSSVTVGSNKQYLYDYRPINAGFDIGYNALTFNLDTVYNPAAISDRRGYLAGLKWGKVKKQGDFAVGYDYRLLERDATVGAFSEGDSAGGGTSIRSHRVTSAYQIGKAMTVALTGFIGQAKIAGDEQQVRRNRVQADLNFKF